MPHQCTDCGRAFADGSKEMLSGCPDCGGNKFQFRPDGVDEGEAPGDGTEPAESPAPEPPAPPEPAVDSSVARTVGKAATTVKDLVGSNDGAPHRGAPADAAPAAEAGTEDAAQASARSEVVAPGDLPPAPDRPATTEAGPAPDPSGSAPASGSDEESGGTPQPADRPDLADLREELNEQFESIKVLEPGQYELNLMELYDREEYIIALQEDGKYTIQVPERYGEA